MGNNSINIDEYVRSKNSSQKSSPRPFINRYSPFPNARTPDNAIYLNRGTLNGNSPGYTNKNIVNYSFLEEYNGYVPTTSSSIRNSKFMKFNQKNILKTSEKNC
jgi:hypothetical protein